MMVEVALHGALARFGGPYRFDIMTPAEAVRALCQIPGFREEISAGEYRLSSGPREYGKDDIGMTFGKADRLDIVPVAAGGKNSGLGKAIAGAALMGVGFYGGFTALGAGESALLGEMGISSVSMGSTAFEVLGVSVTYGNIAMFGATMALGGIVQAMSSQMGIGDLSLESADERRSFLFNGPVNTTEQGLPVPLIFGRMRVGSRVISAGMTAERVP